MTSSATNPFLLAADGSADKLLHLLRQNPLRAKEQDPHGYSLLHALTSYNHISLLRTIVQEFHLDPNTTDEDKETALFVAETVEAAQCLIEEVGVDPELRNEDGQTAEEKIREEGEFVVVSDYLKEVRVKRTDSAAEANGLQEGEGSNGHLPPPPPLPAGVKINLGTMQEGDEGGQEPDPEFKRRIEELAARGDFNDAEGQAQLRELIKDAVRDVNSSERDVRRRLG